MGRLEAPVSGQEPYNLKVNNGDHAARTSSDTLVSRSIDRGFSWLWTSAFNAEGTRFATGDDSGDVGLWDFATGRQLRAFERQTSCIQAIALSPDGSRLAAAGAAELVRLEGPISSTDIPRGGRVTVWDTRTGEVLHTHKNTRSFLAISFSGNGHELTTIDNSFVLRQWNLDDGSEKFSMNDLEARGQGGSDGDKSTIAFSRNATRIVAISDAVEDSKALPADRVTLKLWDLDRRQARNLKTFPQTGRLGRVAISPDGNRIAVVTEHSNLVIFDFTKGEVIDSFRISGGGNLILFSADGNRIISVGGKKGECFVWSSTDGRLLRTLNTPKYFGRVANSHDGRLRVVFGALDHTEWDPKASARRIEPMVLWETDRRDNSDQP